MKTSVRSYLFRSLCEIASLGQIGLSSHLLQPAFIVDTIIRMDIEFDPAKDVLNHAKHGIGLAAAQGFDMDRALVAPDVREDYGEDRWTAVGFIDVTLHVLVFTERDGRLRPISLRKAEKSEVRNYVEQKIKYGF